VEAEPPFVKALFDTNILVDYLNGVPAAPQELARYTHRLISVVTFMEVLAGTRNVDEEDVVEMFLRDFQIVELTRHVAREASAIRRARRIKLPDAVIWGSARTESALLITRNRKDFPADEPGIRIPY
jgi:predicted nucleic acid-binding protein